MASGTSANVCASNGNRCGAHDAISRDDARMKATNRKFNGSWFVVAMVVAIIIGEVVVWEISSRYGIRSNPVVVAFLCAGLVAAITSVLYEGADIS